ncbi:type IV pilus modification PilV family protein [Homoserinibacter sp. YIM 151385]|uniref:type IV pilus modification PilV family protein n=1 Tax=Homoserinibacter sp. YIM 151385 TaxID=2985506 RepID=UPI0022F07987|nr:hypothetical protein [Homoserinibacter sp. YIM 151385]WBU37648.1 hypothetical protein OF852_12110 [Homoserinibacter sp. YIM 151385]
MIRSIRDRMRRSGDAGISLTEVLVAMMVFSLIAVGMSYSIMTIQQLTYDTQRRATATNLAAGEIDSSIGVGNAFDVNRRVDTQTVGGTRYTITREVTWETDRDGDRSACGTSGGNLLYKIVNVSVTWDDMLMIKNDVRADTFIAPVDRLNSPGLGTILISVTGERGAGAADIAVAITPKAGGTGAAIPVQRPTSADGCSYALQVVPGEYNIAISKAGFVDDSQAANPTKTETVTAGQTTAVKFQYDSRVRLDTAYRTNRTSARLPSAMDTTFFAAGRIYSYSSIAAQRDLHPFAEGYTAIAGKYKRPDETDTRGCTNTNPASWAAGPVDGTPKRAGVAAAATASAPGTNGRIDVPMGIVTVKPPAGVTAVRARTAAPASVTYPGDPGCSITMEYTFTGLTADRDNQIALPYGSWTFGYGGSSYSTALPGSRLSVSSDAGAVIGSILTLDPRENGS